MRSFIFDKYGYYPEDENAIKFDYKGWHFELELTNKQSNQVFEMKKFLLNIPTFLPSFNGDIILSRDKKIINDSIYGKVCLVAIKEKHVSLNDLYNFHNSLKDYAKKGENKISNLKKVWEVKVDHIEEKIIPKIKYDNVTYDFLIQNFAFASALAENAIQYLGDSISFYGDIIPDSTLTHKRLKDFTSYTFLNPFNLVIDSPCRDISDLIKYNLIDFETLKKVLNVYNINKASASLLFARLLFPTDLYDMLEEYYLIRNDISNKIIIYNKNIKAKLNQIKKIHEYLVNIYQIKPIEWIYKL